MASRERSESGTSLICTKTSPAESPAFAAGELGTTSDTNIAERGKWTQRGQLKNSSESNSF